MRNFSGREIFKDIRNYLAGRFTGATRDEFFLEELSKLIFCKYEIGNQTIDNSDPIKVSAIYRKAFRSVVSKHSDIYSDPDVEIQLDPESILYVHDHLNSINIFNLKRDLIGDAYEIFIGEAIKGQSGQFFTPQNAAQAIVKMVKPTTDQKILDPACGAGGFLVATIKYWLGNGEKIDGIKIYGIDKDAYLIHLAKIHLACLGVNTKHIICADSLKWDENFLGHMDALYDVILTNPPFGSNIQAGSEETLSKFELAYKYKKHKDNKYYRSDVINTSTPPQVVFLEQCTNLVKENGKIGIVVPESLISSKKYGFVMNFLIRKCKVNACVGMPDELFKTSGKGGTHTKTCLLTLNKCEVSSEYPIFMAEAKWCGHDSRGREIPKDDIPTIVQRYNSYCNTRSGSEDSLGFIVQSNDIENLVFAPRAYLFNLKNNKTFGESHNLLSIGQLIGDGIIEISTGNEVGKLAYGDGTIPFIRTSDISNWEIKADPKHLINENIYTSLKEKQDVQAGDILMVKDGSYLIGTCAMITEYDTKIVYQSHLYKLRVHNRNKYNLNNYYLLAALSSNYVKEQIHAKTFSQDIINSLGDRIKDLIIPIPKDVDKVKSISKMVQQSIDGSIKARELAKKARAAIWD